MRIASYVTRIIGVLLIIFGVVLVFIGRNIYTDFYAQVEYFYKFGTYDSAGLNVFYSGIGISAVGVVLLIVSIIFSVKLRRQFSDTVHDQDYEEFDDMVEQLAGNKTIFDVFHTEDNTRIFSFYRDKTCILKAGEDIHRGTMEPLTWANGHPTLWRITMDFDGSDQSCEVSKVDGNILVKCDDGEQIFYRGAVRA